MRKILIFTFFSLGILNAQISKAGQAGAKFLSLPYDVRSESMGDVGVSLSSLSPFVNPSIISTLNLKTIYGLAGFFWGINNFAISYTIPSKRGNLGFWTSGVYVGGMEGYELDPNGNINSIGNFSYVATQLGFTFSRFLTDKFSFGISPKIIYEGFGGFSNAYSVALDVGTYYITGFKDLVIAASIRHPRHVLLSALYGAHIATIPPKVFYQMIKHPLTDIGIEKFLEDWKKKEN